MLYAVFALGFVLGVLAGFLRSRAERKKLDDAGVLVRKLTKDYVGMHNKHKSLFESIEAIVAERNGVMQDYHEQAAQHASAQDMMMREIKVVSQQYDSLSRAVREAPDLATAQKLAARKLRTNETLAQIASDFQEKHVLPGNPEPGRNPGVVGVADSAAKT